MGVCKYTVPPNKDLDVTHSTSEDAPLTKDVLGFLLCLSQVPGRSQMFKTGPQMDDNNDFFFNCQKVVESHQ